MYCLSSFCCVCLSNTAKLQDINHLDIDGLPLINKIIFVSFGHEAIDFKVVRYICLECTSILQLAYTFKRSCLVNHELLRIYSGQLKYFTGTVSEYRDLIVSLEKLPEKSQEEEEEEEQEEENKNDVNNEEEQFDENEEKKNVAPVKHDYVVAAPRKKKKKVGPTLKCSACDATFNRYVLLQMHYTTKHKSFFKVIKKKLNANKSSFSYVCNICTNKLATLFSLTRHLQLHVNTKIQTTTSPKPTTSQQQHQQLITCNFCPTQIENNESYKKHLYTVHADRSALRCDICDITVKNDFLFRRHMFVKHSPRKCKHCEEVFFNNSELWTHIAENHRVYKCDYCDKAFSHQRNLRTHMKTHESATFETVDMFHINQLLEPIIPEKKQQHQVEEEEEEDNHQEPEMKNESHQTHQNVLLNSRLRKKCTNCLSVFSSSISLKYHKCFKLKNMFQCNNCFIIYSKKSSFTNHVKHCVLPSNLMENVANTPELQESEQLEMNFDETQTTTTTTTTTSTATEENVIKDEHDLEIKEEILDDFICNSKENSIEIGDVYSINEFVETQNDVGVSPQFPQNNAEEKTDEIDNTKKQQQELPTLTPAPQKRTFPKIKLVEKSKLLKRGSDENTDLIQTLRLRWESLHIPIEKSNETDEVTPPADEETPPPDEETLPANEETPPANEDPPEISISPEINKVRRFNLRWKSGVFDDDINVEPVEATDPNLANTEQMQIIEFSDSNDSAAKLADGQNIIDPLLTIDEAGKSRIGDADSAEKLSESLNVNEQITNTKTGEIISPKTSEIIPSTNAKTVESLVSVSEIVESSNVENIKAKKDLLQKRRQSICVVDTSSSNENSNESLLDKINKIDEINKIDKIDNVGLKKPPLRNRRKSIWAETTSNENSNESFVDRTDNNLEKKEPIKRRRKSIWFDDAIELNDNSTDDGDVINTENVESTNAAIVEPKKQPDKSRRKSICLVDTSSNENSNESMFNKIDNVLERAKKAPFKSRRKSIWAETTSNENSNESFIDDHLKQKQKEPVVKRRRKSMWMEINDAVCFRDVESTEKEMDPIRPQPRKDPTNIVNTETSNENVESNEASIEKDPIRLRRKSVFFEDPSNIVNTETSNEKVESNEASIEKNPIRPRRKSVFFEDPTNIVNTETCRENVELNKNVAALKMRRKSVFLEGTSNDVDYTSTDTENNVINGINSGDDNSSGGDALNRNEEIPAKNKNDVISAEKPINMEPIILKTRRSIKHSIKSRRKTISALNRKMETQEIQQNVVDVVEPPSDVNKNIAANVVGVGINDPTTKKLNSSIIPPNASLNSLTTSGGSSSTIQLDDKSICCDEQQQTAAKIIADDLLNANENVPKNNDTSYISVRKVADINNDISGQFN